MTEPSDDARSDGPAFDPSILIDVASDFLFGEEPSLTQADVARQAGVDEETAWALWRYLGFPQVDEGKAAFTSADVEAVETVRRLTEMRVIDPEVLPELVRVMGRTFARLADWQTRVLLRSLELNEQDEPPLEVLTEVIPMVEHVQGYIWRRQLMAAASRMAMRSTVSDEGAPTMGVGFVDIVGYTSRSRQLSARELSALVEWFEGTVSDLVISHGGQVIKTIGDEVLYTLDDPVEAGRLALELVERSESDDRFPEVRVGTAYGPVVARLGDVYGSTVNLAARMTSIARPSRVLVDAELADRLREHDVDHREFRLRRTRRMNVKGFEHVELWSLKRPRGAEGGDQTDDQGDGL
ncbi:MAG: adenylate/guanylate cyclase domain-containing protein [Aeromicrobium erythreum]